MAESVPVDVCLQCGVSREEVKRKGYFCATVSGYEEPEVDREWHQHRWADWHDTDLKGFGIAEHAYARYRRASIEVIESRYGETPCDDTTRYEHLYPDATEVADAEAWWAQSVDQCIRCWRKAPAEPTSTPDPEDRGARGREGATDE